MQVQCKTFAFTDDATLTTQVNAWLQSLRHPAPGTDPFTARELKINFITTAQVLVTATAGGV